MLKIIQFQLAHSLVQNFSQNYYTYRSVMTNSNQNVIQPFSLQQLKCRVIQINNDARVRIITVWNNAICFRFRLVTDIFIYLQIIYQSIIYHLVWRIIEYLSSLLSQQVSFSSPCISFQLEFKSQLQSWSRVGEPSCFVNIY